MVPHQPNRLAALYWLIVVVRLGSPLAKIKVPNPSPVAEADLKNLQLIFEQLVNVTTTIAFLSPIPLTATDADQYEAIVPITGLSDNVTMFLLATVTSGVPTNPTSFCKREDSSDCFLFFLQNLLLQHIPVRNCSRLVNNPLLFDLPRYTLSLGTTYPTVHFKPHSTSFVTLALAAALVHTMPNRSVCDGLPRLTEILTRPLFKVNVSAPRLTSFFQTIQRTVLPENPSLPNITLSQFHYQNVFWTYMIALSAGQCATYRSFLIHTLLTNFSVPYRGELDALVGLSDRALATKTHNITALRLDALNEPPSQESPDNLTPFADIRSIIFDLYVTVRGVHRIQNRLPAFNLTDFLENYAPLWK